MYFAPEAVRELRELGLAAYGPGYFCSRGASLGKPSGLVVTSAFGVFSPAVVVPAVEEGWSKTEPAPLLQARSDGAVASLRRLLGEPDAKQAGRAVALLRRGLDAAEGAGHVLFSGLKSLPFPADPVRATLALLRLLREHRGDSHISVWTKALVKPIEIQLMSELQMGIPLKTYSATRLDGRADGRGDRGDACEGAGWTALRSRRRAGVPASGSSRRRTRWKCRSSTIGAGSGRAAGHLAAVGGDDREGGHRGRRLSRRCERDQRDGARPDVGPR